LSTTTKSAVCLLFVFGSCMIKSMVTTSHVCSGIGRGFSKPVAFCVEFLLTWQEEQRCTYSVTVRVFKKIRPP
jgi:cation transport regulator ChaC